MKGISEIFVLRSIIEYDRYRSEGLKLKTLKLNGIAQDQRIII